MKKIILLAALLSIGYYFFSNQTTEKTIDTYNDLLSKVEKAPVSKAEVQKGANLLASFFCNDESFQESGGSSVQACNKKYLSFKGMCEKRIFKNEKNTFTNKDEVIALSKRFVSCVGIS